MIVRFPCFEVMNKNDKSKLSIENVVPPDEFAIGFPLYSGVDDSVYTNAIAILSASYALDACRELELACNVSDWEQVKSKLVILTRNTTLGNNDVVYHPEYENYPHGNMYFNKKVKQADVTMLPFPLQFPNITETIQKSSQY